MIDFIQTAQAAVSLPTISPTQDLGELIVSIYNYAIAIVGLAVFVQFVRAGFTYLLAAGNAAEVGSAKTHMQNAILGALLLLSSYLILNVINPDLLNIKLFDLDKVAEEIKKAKLASDSPERSSGYIPASGTPLPNDNAKAKLLAAGITTSAKLDGIAQSTVNELTDLAIKCGCSLDITSFKVENSSNTTVPRGNVVTLRASDELTEYIVDTFGSEGNKTVDGKEVSVYGGFTGTNYASTGGPTVSTNEWTLFMPRIN